jgi:cytochrome c oxidase subunit II
LAPLRTRARRLLASLGAVLVALATSAAPAGANLVSPEPAHSPGADKLNTLYWIVVVVSMLLIVAINAALLAAVARHRERRGVEPRQLRGGRRIQIRVTAVLAALAVALFVVSIVFTQKARDVPSTGPQGLQASSSVSGSSATPPASGNATPPASGGANPLIITATGQQWLWRYTYPNGAFSYYKLVVPVDTAVQLNLNSTDVQHGWFVPQLSGKFDAVPGKTNKLTFRADRLGTYAGRSSTFSGAAYAADRIEVNVVTPQRYQAFIKAQQRDIQAAQDIVVKQIQSGQTP